MFAHDKMLFSQRIWRNYVTPNGYYRPPTELRGGNVFSPVCVSVHRGSKWLLPGPPPWTDWKAGASHSTETRSCNGNNIAIEFWPLSRRGRDSRCDIGIGTFFFFCKDVALVAPKTFVNTYNVFQTISSSVFNNPPHVSNLLHMKKYLQINDLKETQ